MEQNHRNIKLKLEKKLKDNLIKNYILNTYRGESTQLSSTGNGLGGIYDPLNNTKALTGGIQIEWPNGTISKSVINFHWIKNFEKEFENLKKYSYIDESEKTYIEQPKSYQKSKQYSCKLYDQELDLKSEFIKPLKKLQDWMTKLNEPSQYSGFEYNSSRQTVTNSLGLNLEQKFTNIVIAADLGEFTYFSISGRSLKDLAKIEQNIKRTESFYVNIKKEFANKRIPSKVIFAPNVFEDLIEYFIIENLQAGGIYYNNSPFSLENFKNKIQIANSDLDIILTPKQNMTLGAKDFSSKGLLHANKYEFIKSGKLEQPITSSRYSKLLGISPTAQIGSFKTINFGNIQEEELLEKTFNREEDFVYVSQILGLHTQDSATGDFSLVSPKSLIYKNNKPQGSTEIMIRGNMFEILKHTKKIFQDSLTNKYYSITKNVEIVNL